VADSGYKENKKILLIVVILSKKFPDMSGLSSTPGKSYRKKSS